MTNPAAPTRRVLPFDPELVHLRGAVAAMIAVLLSFWSMVELSGFAPVDVDSIVLSVVVAVMLTRRDLGDDLRERAGDLGVLAVATVIAALVGMLSHQVEFLGEAVFVLALGGFVWARRFGARAARLGTIATLPFIATLVTPLPLPVTSGFTLWALVAIAVAFGWTSLVQWVRARPADRHTAAAAPASQTVPAAPATPTAHRTLAPSTRMAMQLIVALAVAFLAGHMLFPDHLVWPVITAFIVCAGNRGRGDVVHKGVLRIAGALAGTLLASLVTGVTLPGGPLAITLIFVALTIALWLRPLSYAYWAAGVTAALALLYGYFGQTGPGVLESRLLGVLVGGVLAVAASWFILPVRTTDVLRARSGAALRALAAYTAAVRAGRPAEELEEHRHAAAGAIARVAEAASAPRTLERLRSGLVSARWVPKTVRAWASAQRISAGNLAELVADAGAEFETLAAAVASGAGNRDPLTELGRRLRSLAAALDELRRPSQ